MSAHDTHNDPSEGFPHGSREDYVKGFFLAVILTAIPFTVVMAGGIVSERFTAFLILICAVIQIIVHMVYFLHMNTRSQGGWLLISLAFTIIVLVIAIVGTMWVMHNMDVNMMPGMGTAPDS